MVFIAWCGAMGRLGVDRTGVFNGLIPVSSLAAVALTGTGTITPLQLLGALAVLADVIIGLSRARQVPAGTVNPAWAAGELVPGPPFWRGTLNSATRRIRLITGPDCGQTRRAGRRTERLEASIMPYWTRQH
jgi:hypothetical protein